MSLDAWITLMVIVAVIALLASERLSAPVVVLGGVTALLLIGVVDAKQAFVGFSSEAPVTIAALYVMAGAAELSGALDRATALAVGRRLPRDGQARPTRRELTRLLVPSALLSTVLYNTPTIGLIAPQVTGWARRSRRSPSWYLLALNAAVLLGGLVTAIGTTTNIVVSGLLVEAGERPLGLFEITRVGLPVAAVGLAVLLLITPWTSPTRRPSSPYDDDARDFTLEMEVTQGGPLDGTSVADAGLRNLEGVFLVELTRAGQSLAPVPPDEVLTGRDQLTFAGNVARALDLQRVVGLVSAESRHFSVRDPERAFYEVVLASGSSLVGSTLKEADFRSRVGAAVVAIHRSGERVPGKLGGVRLRAGDVLLVIAASDFGTRARQGGDFAVVAPVRGTPPVRREMSLRVGLVFAGFLVCAATGVLDVLRASLLAAFALLLLRVLTPRQARQAVSLDVVVTLAASFGLGAAMTASGLATELADLLVPLTSGSGPAGVLIGILVTTVVITQVVTNNAAAIVMFPVALAAARSVGGDVRMFALAVAVGASLSFLTPIAYQTNLVVQGLAGYRFRDFLPLGLVLVAACTVAAAAGLVWFA